MKWDWGMFGSAVAVAVGACLHEIADLFQVAGAMLDEDHNHRLDRQDFANSVREAIEELPGGVDG